MDTSTAFHLASHAANMVRALRIHVNFYGQCLRPSDVAIYEQQRRKWEEITDRFLKDMELMSDKDQLEVNKKFIRSVLMDSVGA